MVFNWLVVSIEGMVLKFQQVRRYKIEGVVCMCIYIFYISWLSALDPLTSNR